MLLNKNYTFKDNNDAKEAFVVPEGKWFRILRKHVDIESLL
jgi:hypothetical protein